MLISYKLNNGGLGCLSVVCLRWCFMVSCWRVTGIKVEFNRSVIWIRSFVWWTFLPCSHAPLRSTEDSHQVARWLPSGQWCVDRCGLRIWIPLPADIVELTNDVNSLMIVRLRCKFRFCVLYVVAVVKAWWAITIGISEDCLQWRLSYNSRR